MIFIRGGSQGWLGGSLHDDASLTVSEEERETRENGNVPDYHTALRSFVKAAWGYGEGGGRVTRGKVGYRSSPPPPGNGSTSAFLLHSVIGWK